MRLCVHSRALAQWYKFCIILRCPPVNKKYGKNVKTCFGCFQATTSIHFLICKTMFTFLVEFGNQLATISTLTPSRLIQLRSISLELRANYILRSHSLRCREQSVGVQVRAVRNTAAQRHCFRGRPTAGVASAKPSIRCTRAHDDSTRKE